MIYIKKDNKEPLYLQIYSQMKKEILDGVLKEDQILTGSRSLAQTLKISRNTVDNAYGQLLAEGYIRPKKGIAYMVMRVPEIKISEGRKSIIKHEKQPNIHRNPSKVLFDLTNSSYTSDLFPKSIWKRYTLECLERLECEAKISSYQDKQGELYLRHNLRIYLERIRGVCCDESQIIITCGI